MKINTKILGVLIIIILFGGVFASKAFGFWQTESSKTPSKIKDGEFAGESNPEDIRGSYTLKDVSKSFEVDEGVLLKAFRIDANPDEFQLKELETIYINNGDVEIGTGSVRFFTALYTGLPYTDESYILESGLTILLEESKITKEKADELRNKGLIINYSYFNQQEQKDSETIPTHEDESFSIKGKTTVQEALDNGIEYSLIEELLGDIKNKNITIRDICNQKGISFSEVKDVLNKKLLEN